MISVLKDTFSVSEENSSATLTKRLHGVTSYRNASPTEKISKIQDVKELRNSYLYGRTFNGFLALGSMKSINEDREGKPQLSDRMKKSLAENNSTDEEEEEEENQDYIDQAIQEATSLENLEPQSTKQTPKEEVVKKLEDSGTFEPMGNVGRGSLFRVTFSGTNGFKRTTRDEQSQGKENKGNAKTDNNVLNDLIQKSWHDKELFRKLLHKHSDEDLLQLKVRIKKDAKEEKKIEKSKKERAQSRAMTARMPVLAIDLKENQVDETDSPSSNEHTNTNANSLPPKPKVDRRESTTRSLEKSHTVLGNHYKNGIPPFRRQSEKIDKKTLYEKTQDKVAMKGYNIFKLSSLQVSVPSTSQTLNPTPQSARPLVEDQAIKAPHGRHLSLASKNRQIEKPSMVYVAQTHRELRNYESSRGDSSYGIQKLRKIGPTSPTYSSVPKERVRDIKSFLTKVAPSGEEQETEDVSIMKRRSPFIMADHINEKEGTISKVLEQKKSEKVNIPKLTFRRIQL